MDPTSTVGLFFALLAEQITGQAMAIGCHPPCANTGGDGTALQLSEGFTDSTNRSLCTAGAAGAESCMPDLHAQPTVQLQHENHCSTPPHLGSGPSSVSQPRYFSWSMIPYRYQPLLEQELSTSHGDEKHRIHPHSLSGCSGQGCFPPLMVPAAQTHSWKSLWLCSMPRVQA